MKKTLKIILVILVTSLLISTTALAAGDYAINRWTIDNGGGTSQSDGGQYTLSGTIGQWEAGETSSGGYYALNGGFWGVMKSILYEFLVYVPLALR